MGMQFFSPTDLKGRLKSQNNITLLFGSALTMQKDGIGIPGVVGVIDIIKSYVTERGMSEDYESFIKGKSQKELYQESFSFISVYIGADAIKDVVTRVVMSNFDEENESHKIPPAVEDLINLIEKGELKVRNIITTNFDTLIEEQLKNKGIPYNSYSMVTDSNTPDTDNNYINIFHIHGVWNRGDTMHTRNQLEASRKKTEASLQRLLGNGHVVVMAYGGWDDSFTRSLAQIMNDDKAEYNLAWCFYEKEEGIIDREYKDFFEILQNAITRDRVIFINGVDCTTFFKDFSSKERSLQTKTTGTGKIIKGAVIDKQDPDIIFYAPEVKAYYQNIRPQEQRRAISLFNKYRAAFVESGIGFGLFGFVSSLSKHFPDGKVSFLRVDMTDVISKNETENRIHAQTGFAPSTLFYKLSADSGKSFIIIFDNIRSNADEDALSYLLHLAELLNNLAANVFIVFSSGSKIRTFESIHIKLNELTWHETMLILQAQFGLSRFIHSELTEIHEKSEGVIGKLERLIYFLEDSSTEEVLEQDDILDSTFYDESIPSTMLKRIELLATSPDKIQTFKMLKLLSVLKNGETLKNLRRSNLGRGLTSSNTKELVNAELATSFHIDNSTTIVKVNPIIKDYILSRMELGEIHSIGQEYLGYAIVVGKDGIKISSVNRKIYDIGYQAEEDNANTLLRINITECKDALKNIKTGDSNKERLEVRLRKLLYLSYAYVYTLENSSRYNELIIAASNIMVLIQDIGSDDLYKYYYSLAYAYRMKGNKNEAWKYLNLCKESCPDSDKGMVSRLYIEELYLLQSENIQTAIALAKEKKNTFKRDSNAFIVSEQILSSIKPRGEKIKTLVRLEKKARTQSFHSLANNILFELSRNYDASQRISASNKITQTDPGNYNIARAIILKFETMVESGMFEQISDRDIDTLVQVYNYLFSQQFDHLFNRCYDVLRVIAMSRNESLLFFRISFKAIIMWKLNFNDNNEKKYIELINSDGFKDEKVSS